MGYIGSSLLLIVILLLTQSELFGFKMPIRYAFALTGIWWMVFAQITFRRLSPSTTKGAPNEGEKKKNLFGSGYSELKHVWDDLKHRLQLRRFLASYFMYNMGVQTVMIMAVPFAAKEVKGLETSNLIIRICQICLRNISLKKKIWLN